MRIQRMVDTWEAAVVWYFWWPALASHLATIDARCALSGAWS